MTHYKLSPSELTFLFEGCKLCFWLKIRHGIAQPSMPMPGIFSTIAGLQDRFYANKRTDALCPALPPGTVHLGEERVQSKLIEVPGAKDLCYIKGRFDCVVKFDDGTFGIIDFKTSKPSQDKSAMYGRQLQAYTYALENPEDGNTHLSPVTKLGLLYLTPDTYEQIDFENQAFKGKVAWVEVERNDEKFVDFLKEVMAIVSEDKPPMSAANCGWCKYRSKMDGFDFEKPVAKKKAEGDPETPECPKCSGEMRRRTGKFGEFWSCIKYPECKGTRNMSKS